MRRISSYSPLRVSFAGGGTDISPFLEMYGTDVVNTTIDRGVYVSYVEDSSPLEITSRDFLKTIVFGGDNGANFQEKIMDLFIKSGIEKGRIYINGEVPPGSGLGSSSAMVNSITRIIQELNGEYTGSLDLAKKSYQTEREHFNITLGIQDPFAIAEGGFKYMESDGTSFVFRHLEKSHIMEKLEEGMIIAYTGSTRESSEVLKDQVIKSRRGEKDVLENLRHLKQIAREIVTSTEESDWGRFCEKINEGWKIKKSLGKNVSGEKVDNIIKMALENGAKAARLLGGGMQGFVLILAEREDIWKIQNQMKKLSGFVMRVSPSTTGTHLFSF
ncbi:MAG: kinase [Candidatus Thermoplasmatota archaeon]|jgi:D-glycero-alpha-D-manno-heptose-7-phosphate kinase|nr:kinase [Candidatus Thermoplasmatota archaeon]MCL5790524.1 kinase [Candidatus Thermoplasmatota archaeon]